MFASFILDIHHLLSFVLFAESPLPPYQIKCRTQFITAWMYTPLVLKIHHLHPLVLFAEACFSAHFSKGCALVTRLAFRHRACEESKIPLWSSLRIDGYILASRFCRYRISAVLISS
jgi:hypothetical protein